MLMALILGGGRNSDSTSSGMRLGGSLFSTEMLRVLADVAADPSSGQRKSGAYTGG
jgi:hypothetical protein